MKYQIYAFISMCLLAPWQASLAMEQKDQVARISPEVLAYVAQHYQNHDAWMTYGDFSSSSVGSSSSTQATTSAVECKCVVDKSVKLYDDILTRLGVDIRRVLQCAGQLTGPCLISDLFSSLLSDMFKKNHETSVQQWRKLLADRVAWGAVIKVNPDNRGFSSMALDSSYEYVYHMYYENGIIEHICYEEDGQRYKAILEMEGLEPIVIARRISDEVHMDDEIKENGEQNERGMAANSAASPLGASHAPMLRAIGQREELDALCAQTTEARVRVLNNAERVHMEIKSSGVSATTVINVPVQMLQLPSNSRIINLVIGGDNS